MSKKWYKLVFKQLQPIHIGAGSYGVINETRIFIPGWTMWGALTKAYNIQKGLDLSQNQDWFEEISCFYPCFDDKGEKPLLPNLKNGEFCLGKFSEEEFRAKFVNTYISTAVVPGSRMAKEESLHEIDIILPSIKKDYMEENNERHLYWIGIINVKNDIKDFFKNGLKIYVGGDSKYGFGLLVLTKKDKIERDSEKFENFLLSNFVSLDLVRKMDSKIEFLAEVTGYEGAQLTVNKSGYFFIPNIETTDIPESVSLKKGILG